MVSYYPDSICEMVMKYISICLMYPHRLTQLPLHRSHPSCSKCVLLYYFGVTEVGSLNH